VLHYRYILLYVYININIYMHIQICVCVCVCNIYICIHAHNIRMYVCMYNINGIPEGGVCGVEMRILGPEETDGAITGGSGLIPCLRPNRKAARWRDLLHQQKKNVLHYM
jgi:hypothetical protein